MAARRRADVLLLEQGGASSIDEARRLIMAGRARVGTRVLVQPGTLLGSEAEIAVGTPDPYVSRGGLKLANALAGFQMDVEGLNCLDIGASTGGFTDCLLQHRARSVIAVDVGRGVLHSKLRGDARVSVLEGTNGRELPAIDPVQLFVADVSFTSLRAVLPPIAARIGATIPGLVLFKPQFEAPRADVPPDGILRDASVRRQALDRFAAWLAVQGWLIHGVREASPRGEKGNVELFLRITSPEVGQC